MSSPTSSASAMAAPVKRHPEDYHFLTVIGEGSFSTVYLCRELVSKRFCAIKVCRKQHILKEKKVEYVKREKNAYQILDGNPKESAPFFLKLACSFQDSSCLYYVLSLAEKGDLLQYLVKNGPMNLPCARFYAGELIHALEHMHGLGIIHRDIKPENILLTAAMHIHISDFGSAKILHSPLAPPEYKAPPSSARGESGGGEAAGEEREAQDGQRGRMRRMSFVGTAQYVSPEILNSWPSTPAADLWAYGAVLYQLLANAPPFRGQGNYPIFQKILKLDYTFPDNFPDTAKDLIQKLLILEPSERLGARDYRVYSSIKGHDFFDGLDFETLWKQTPPEPAASYPMSLLTDEVRKESNDIVPGLSSERLLQVEFNMASKEAEGELKPQPVPTPVVPKRKRITDMSADEKKRRLEIQKKSSPWHKFTRGNLILKQGLLDKRKGLFPRRRMFLLTFGPHLFYIEPDHLELKGEVPWSRDLRPEAKTTKAFKAFVVHTPNRVYYLEDPAGYALEWCQAIQDVRDFYYGDPKSP